MITNQIIQNEIDNLNEITKVEFCVYTPDGDMIVKSKGAVECEAEIISTFLESKADSQSINDSHYMKVLEDGDVAYVIQSIGSVEFAHTIGKIAVSQLESLIVAYKDKLDRSTFFQNLLMDNLLLVDIHNRASKLHIENERNRMVFLVELKNDKDNVATQLLKSMFVQQGGNYITSVNDSTIALIKDIGSDSEKEECEEIAHTIVDMLGAEAMLSVRVAYGLPVKELKNLSKCYKEAKMALEVGSIFHSQMTVLSYENLGIGRLIYQLPINLCKIFVKEVFGDTKPEDIDEETLSTINKFFENNLNVSETARQLYIHRNTLVYKMEKLKAAIGLDMRQFDDAVTFKIVMMVVDYVTYLENQE